MLRHRQASARQQRGVAAIFAAISLVALLSALALGIDVGRLYLTQRDFQRLADLAAIDAARVSGGCLAGAGGREQAAIEARASLGRNGLPSGTTVQTLIGKRVNNNNVLAFEAVAESQPWDSVQVQIEGDSPARILPLFSGAETRKLHAQAAAFAGVSVRFDPIPSLAVADDQILLGQTLATQLGGSADALVLDASGTHSSGSATVRIGDLIDASERSGEDGSELDQTIPVRGLLSRVAELLRNSGDAASAAVTQSVANTVDTTRSVIPRQILGIPTGTPRALFEDAVVRVDSLLTAVTSTVGRGLDIPGQIRLPPAVCSLAASLGVLLCDMSITSRVEVPGTGAVISSGVDTRGTSSFDFTQSVGGVLQFNLQIVEPVSGTRFELPINVSQDAVRGTAGDFTCARRGVALSSARLLTEGGAVTVGLGTAGDPAAGNVSSLPLNLTLGGVPAQLSIAAAPQTVGGGREELCFSGPPFPTQRLCDGSPALAGRVTGDDIAAAIAGLRPTVSLGVGSGTLPIGPTTAALLAPVLDSLNRLLPAVLNALSLQALPVLRSSNLPAGGVAFSLSSFNAPAPTVYAR